MVPEDQCLRRNVAPWDRAVRLGLAVAVVAGLPYLARNPFVLILGGVVSGFWLFAGLLGY